LPAAAAERSASEPALASVEQMVPGKLLMYLQRINLDGNVLLVYDLDVGRATSRVPFGE
jgi:hypothetical protein